MTVLAEPRRRGGAVWRMGAFCATVLLLVLPALLAARHLGDAARSDEIGRLTRAFDVDDTGLRDGAVARQFYRNCAPVDAMPTEPEAAQAVVVRARAGQLAVVLGIGLLLYLVMVVARGRLQALLACLGFATLPAVAGEGHVLRAESPALLFATFGLLAMQCVARAPRRGRTSSGPRLLSTAGLGCSGMLGLALGVATLPTNGVWLLVPGVVLSIAAVQIGLRSARLLPRRGWLGLPIRAINARLLPWTAMALLTPVVALWLLRRALSGPAEALLPTVGVPFLPANTVGATAVVALLLLGAGAALLRTGSRLRQSGRIDAGLVWLAFCAVGFAGAMGAARDSDRLPLAVAAASLLGEGAFVVLLLLQRLIGRRGNRAAAAATSP